MRFIKFAGNVFAFHDPETADLASYMVENLDYVQCLNSEIRITCNKTFSTKLLKLSASGVPMLDLRTTLDTASLWKLGQAIKLYQGVYYGA